ncbi:MAG: flippase-like domain-containing protein [Alphaproteobacteria bacterium]|nr:flippase-like domain-containing protein [Alphaproteobacteria bacterium]
MNSQNESDTGGAPARKWRRAAVLLVVGVAILVWLLSQITLADFRNAWARVDWAVLALGISFSLSATLVRALRFAVLFESRGNLIRLYGVFAQWRLVNMVLPFKIGEVAALVMLKKYGFAGSIAEAAPTWIVVRVFDLLAILAWFGAVLLIAGQEMLREVGMEETPVILAIAAVLAGLGLVFAYGLTALGPFGHDNTSWLAQRARAFRDGVHRINNTRRIAACGILSMLLWGIAIAVPTILQFAFEVPLAALDCLLISLIVLVASMLPVHAPLSLGTGDLIWAGALMLFGLPETEAIVLAISIRLSLIALICLEGGIGTMILLGRQPPPAHQGTAPDE